jgi:hypothetical protein
MAFVRGKQPLGRDANSNRVRAAAVHTARHVSPQPPPPRKRWGVVVMRWWRWRCVQGMGVGNRVLGVYGVGAWGCEREKEKSERERVENRCIHPTASLRSAFLRL